MKTITFKEKAFSFETGYFKRERTDEWMDGIIVDYGQGGIYDLHTGEEIGKCYDFNSGVIFLNNVDITMSYSHREDSCIIGIQITDSTIVPVLTSKEVKSTNFFDLDFTSQNKFEKDYGDVFSLQEFLRMTDEGMIIDGDGEAYEILNEKNMILYKESFSPSDVTVYKEELLNAQKEHGQLYVVWYNK